VLTLLWSSRFRHIIPARRKTCVLAGKVSCVFQRTRKAQVRLLEERWPATRTSREEHGTKAFPDPTLNSNWSGFSRLVSSMFFRISFLYGVAAYLWCLFLPIPEPVSHP
jgi:hypothetical protein